MKYVVNDPKTGDTKEIHENIAKVCSEAWGDLNFDIQSQWRTKALQYQVETLRSDEGRSDIRSLLVEELKEIAQVLFYILLIVPGSRSR